MTASKLPSWPRAMRAETAAAYVGLSETDFLARARAGEFRAKSPSRPGQAAPSRIVLYCRDDLDRWIDQLFGIDGQAPAQSITDGTAALAAAIASRGKRRRNQTGSGNRGRQDPIRDLPEGRQL